MSWLRFDETCGMTLTCSCHAAPMAQLHWGPNLCCNALEAKRPTLVQ